MYRRLEWDTEFFEMEIARSDPRDLAQLELDLRQAARDGVQCTYVLAPAEDTALLQALMQRSGTAQVDVRLTLSCRASEIRSRAPSYPLELADERDLAALIPLARQAHVDSRFFADWRFDRDRVEALYERWIERSVQGWAARVFTARVEGEAMGYVTAHVEDGEGSIGLVAIAEQMRGKGLGSTLMGHAMRWFEAQQVERVTVVTQARNVAAQRLYQSHGFRTEQAQVWFHCWNE